MGIGSWTKRQLLERHWLSKKNRWAYANIDPTLITILPQFISKLEQKGSGETTHLRGALQTCNEKIAIYQKIMKRLRIEAEGRYTEAQWTNIFDSWAKRWIDLRTFKANMKTNRALIEKQQAELDKIEALLASKGLVPTAQQRALRKAINDAKNAIVLYEKGKLPLPAVIARYQVLYHTVKKGLAAQFFVMLTVGKAQMNPVNVDDIDDALAKELSRKIAQELKFVFMACTMCYDEIESLDKLLKIKDLGLKKGQLNTFRRAISRLSMAIPKI